MSVFTSEPLNEAHELAYFSCGKAALDSWLIDHAWHAQKHGTAQTHVWARQQTVMAYYSLANHLVERDQLPTRVSRGAPRDIPAVLLAKFALHKSLHGRGLGGELLADAMKTVIELSELSGVHLVVVDAIDEEGISFYEHFGYLQIPGNPSRLVKKISTLQKELE